MKPRGNHDELLLKVPEEDTAVRLSGAAAVAELLERYKDKQYHSLEEKIFSDWPRLDVTGRRFLQTNLLP